jgi:hypothetical protein
VLKPTTYAVVLRLTPLSRSDRPRCDRVDAWATLRAGRPARVGPGDIVVGNEDGVVVPNSRIEETIAGLANVRAAAAALDVKVKAGLQIPEFLQALIDDQRFREVD